LPSSGGFDAPKGYFEQFELKNFDELELSKDFGDSSNFFATPAGYFEQLDAKIIEKISKKENRFLSINRKEIIYWVSGIAATLAFVSFFFLGGTKPQSLSDNEVNLSTEEIAEQLSLSDVNAELLCDAGWCNELEKLNKEEDNSIETLIDTDEELIIEEL
jgi:hypothetical protein